MSKFYEGKENAPVGILAGIGQSGPGVLIEARDEAHEAAIRASGHYKAAAAPKAEELPEGQVRRLPADAYTFLLPPEAEAETKAEPAPTPDAPPAATGKKEGK